ncbi:hypothetical protein [Methanobrevibacter sp.]|uniref:hypothetical protein n=1 Tax=Methanobrevibacter sp. TaxID=66852 RepID=UPI00388DD4F5
MDKFIEDLLDDLFDIKTYTEYHFREIHGLTFAFCEKIVLINDKISSAEIRPVGIIYEENGQYYLALLHDIIEIDEVVKEFVRNLEK